jgi:hypothetical protein
MQLRIMGLEEEKRLNIPPPLLVAELPVKVVLVMLGEEEPKLNTPPPKVVTGKGGVGDAGVGGEVSHPAVGCQPSYW